MKRFGLFLLLSGIVGNIMGSSIKMELTLDNRTMRTIQVKLSNGETYIIKKGQTITLENHSTLKSATGYTSEQIKLRNKSYVIFGSTSPRYGSFIFSDKYISFSSGS